MRTLEFNIESDNTDKHRSRKVKGILKTTDGVFEFTSTRCDWQDSLFGKRFCHSIYQTDSIYRPSWELEQKVKRSLTRLIDNRT